MKFSLSDELRIPYDSKYLDNISTNKLNKMVLDRYNHVINTINILGIINPLISNKESHIISGDLYIMQSPDNKDITIHYKNRTVFSTTQKFYSPGLWIDELYNAFKKLRHNENIIFGKKFRSILSGKGL